jgi:hypothetical protein
MIPLPVLEKAEGSGLLPLMIRSLKAIPLPVLLKAEVSGLQRLCQRPRSLKLRKLRRKLDLELLLGRSRCIEEALLIDWRLQLSMVCMNDEGVFVYIALSVAFLWPNTIEKSMDFALRDWFE